jgi:hypothetical protein
VTAAHGRNAYGAALVALLCRTGGRGGMLPKEKTPPIALRCPPLDMNAIGGTRGCHSGLGG